MASLANENFTRDLLAYADGKMSVLTSAVKASFKPGHGHEVGLADVMFEINNILKRPQPDFLKANSSLSTHARSPRTTAPHLTPR